MLTFTPGAKNLGAKEPQELQSNIPDSIVLPTQKKRSALIDLIDAKDIADSIMLPSQKQLSDLKELINEKIKSASKPKR